MQASQKLGIKLNKARWDANDFDLDTYNNIKYLLYSYTTLTS